MTLKFDVNESGGVIVEEAPSDVHLILGSFTCRGEEATFCAAQKVVD